jgi:hypothetical protein
MKTRILDVAQEKNSGHLRQPDVKADCFPKGKRQTFAVCRFDSSQELKAKSQKLLHRPNALAQAGLIARRGVLVQQPLLNAFVERGYRLAVGLLGGGLVAFFNGLAQVAQLSTKSGSVGAIARGAAFGLARTLQRRKMICHSWSLPLCVLRDIRGRSELLIIWDRLRPVKPALV